MVGIFTFHDARNWNRAVPFSQQLLHLKIICFHKGIPIGANRKTIFKTRPKDITKVILASISGVIVRG